MLFHPVEREVGGGGLSCIVARLINGLRTLDLIGPRADRKGNPRPALLPATRLGFVRIYPLELISLLTLLSNLS